MPPQATTATRQKTLGAFYTPDSMAAVLTSWAITAATDRVLDPSFGGLVFLESAARRLEEIGASAAAARSQLWGVDLDEGAFAPSEARQLLGLPPSQLLEADFFALTAQDLPVFHAVVGNPPYVRYQGWNGEAARQRCEAAGVPMTRLASTWAPFVVHASAFVADGGRLAMVLPAELLHAQYAHHALAFLERSYSRLQLAVFEQRIFPGALEEVVLLRASGRRRAPGPDAGLELTEYKALNDFVRDQGDAASSPPQPRRNSEKLLVQLLPTQTRDLWDQLGADGRVHHFGELASVDIGAVTGANNFFLLSAAVAGAVGPRSTTPCISKAAHIPGARLRYADVERLRGEGIPVDLLTPQRTLSADELAPAIQTLIAQGEREGLDERYKCRVRNPWWAVPLPGERPPDLFLTYFAHEAPRLVLNEAGARHTNTIHGVRLHDPTVAPALAAGFINSLTLLSAELVGRSYGGGVLKLEPTEAEALLLPPIDALHAEELDRIDGLMRNEGLDAVLDVVDAAVLGKGLGLRAREIRALRDAGAKLRGRRRARGRKPKS